MLVNQHRSACELVNLPPDYVEVWDNSIYGAEFTVAIQILCLENKFGKLSFRARCPTETHGSDQLIAKVRAESPSQ